MDVRTINKIKSLEYGNQGTTHDDGAVARDKDGRPDTDSARCVVLAEATGLGSPVHNNRTTTTTLAPPSWVELFGVFSKQTSNYM